MQELDTQTLAEAEAKRDNLKQAWKNEKDLSKKVEAYKRYIQADREVTRILGGY